MAFRFTPSSDPLVSRAFSKPFCGLAIAVVLGCGYSLWRLWSQDRFTTAGPVATEFLPWALAALALMAYSLWCIVTSTTTLTARSLKQSFVWDKEIALQELAYCKLIRVPGLDWLIAPRLYCRTILGKFAVFYAAEPAMIAEMQRLRDELDAFRRNG
jgi:hypothetical protein